MAKNLKINIKNAQLAEALKLTRAKNPSAKKKEEERPIESVAVAKETPPPLDPVSPAIEQSVVKEPPAQSPSTQNKEPDNVLLTPAKPEYRNKPQPFRTNFPPRRSPYFKQDTRPVNNSSNSRSSYPAKNAEYSTGLKKPIPHKDSTLSKPSDTSKKEPIKLASREIEDKNQRSKPLYELKPAKKAPQKTFDARDRKGLRDDLEDQGWRRRRPHNKMRSHKKEEVVIRPKELKIHIPITIKELASEMKLKASQLVSKLFMKGVMLTLNDYLDDETTIQLLGHDFDCEITIDTSEEERLRITDKTIKQEIQANELSDLITRPPVIAFMGHVDHGKTSLIDAIRESNVASSEAGDITQHIGAFKCHTDTGDITILDTPGHEAFSSMRARGADVTDIVVLVIAGDEGIKAQTIEAIDQAKAAGVPILVAINKCDKPNFDAENIYRQLADKDLLPEAWGGQVITVNCSAVTKEGIKEMLEMLALQAEILELKANPKSRARGTVIESEMHKGLGPIATVLVQNGTLYIGNAIVFAQHYARVKTMHNEHNQEITTAGPSSPVKITGLSGLPEAGSEFIVVKNEKEAMEIAKKRSEGQRYHAMMQQPKRVSLENFLDKSTQKKTLNLILRADVQGSVEALKNSLLKIQSKKIELNIISAAVGEVSESDIQLAQNTKATIVGFHTQIENHAENLIKTLKVPVKLYDIIYHAVNEIRALMRSQLDKIPQEDDVGLAEVKAVFKSSQLGIIAGCMVTEGTIKRSSQIRLIRQGQIIWKGTIQSLKRIKEDVREVSKGYECGIVLPNNNDIKVGDVFQAYETTYLDQEL